MFYSLTGELIYTDDTSVAVNCGGIGFKCLVTANTLNRIGPAGSKVTLFTHLIVKEDAFEMLGFADETELELFRLLILVNGVGSKVALAILSALKPDTLALCIAAGDTAMITRAPGVGPKLAQRIVLELKDKIRGDIPMGISAGSIAAVEAADGASAAREAVSALESLGYSRSEASAAVGRLGEGLTTQQYVTQALKSFNKQ